MSQHNTLGFHIILSTSSSKRDVKDCVSLSDFSQEKWCQNYFLCCAALQMADAIRAELTDILKRIELPISEPSFGSKTNAISIKRALLAGYFMQVPKLV